jgi:predicted glycosyltransferase
MFKNFIGEMERRGHEVKILAIEKEITEYLLKQFDMPYTLIGNNPPQVYKKVLSVPKWEYLTLKIALEFKPDIYIGQALPHFAHVSAVLRKPYILFEDSEPAHAVQVVSLPFAQAVVTPCCYKDDLGEKQICFDGYFELAYLHPNIFKPNPAVLDELGLNKNDKFIIMRFVSWTAVHDIGQCGGFDLEMKKKVVKELEKYAHIFITSERPLPEEFEKYRINVSLDKIHDMLYYAQMFVGDSQTMTTEAGVLGTPAIRCNSFVGENDMGNFIELEQKYGLIFNYNDSDKAIEKAVELIQKPKLKEEWNAKKEKLLKDKTDVARFMVEFVEGYPDSFFEYKKDVKGI